MACIGGIDPANVIFPEPTRVLQQILHFSTRFVLASCILAQVFAILCSSHLAIFIFIIHLKSCIEFLKDYKPPPTQSNGNPNTKKSCNVKKTNGFVSYLGQSLSDLQLYRIVSVANLFVRQYIDTVAVFSMVPGFCCMDIFHSFFIF